VKNSTLIEPTPRTVAYGLFGMAALLLSLVAIALLVSPTRARAADTGKITVAQAIPLATALRNLDGHMVVIKQNGADNVVMTPWDFGSGSLRLRIANNLTILAAIEKSAEDGRQAIIKEILKKTGGSDIKPGTPDYEDYQRQFADLMAQPASGSQDLSRLKASELKLDRNEIPVTVLSTLGPILENDVR